MAKILLVDDDKSIQNILGKLIKKVYGHEIIPAFDGEEGLKKLDEIKDIQLIFLDYNMGLMNGFEFSEKVRNNLTECDLPNTVVELDSLELTPETFGKKFDLIFQDGNHDTKHVLAEMESMYPSVLIQVQAS